MMNKIFDKIKAKKLYYAIFNTLLVFGASTIVALNAMSVSVSSDIDLRFIGPVALFLLVLSSVFTVFPFAWLRVKAAEQLSKAGKRFSSDVPKTFVIVETVITAFMLLFYTGAMAGSIWGGVGLILLSVLNIIGIVISALIAGFGLGMNKYSQEAFKYKVNSLVNDNNHVVLNDDEVEYKETARKGF